VNKTFKYHTHLLQPFELCAMSQNYDYCTDNDVMGPIFASALTAQNQQGNVFFIASHDKFDGEAGESMYEYHEIKGGIDYGYMFGLFSMRNASWTDIKNTLMQTEENIGAKVDGDCQNEIRGIKVKKNLGSLIQKVGNFSQDGYSIDYYHGDVCETDFEGNGDIRFSSTVHYICNNETDDYGWPELTHTLNKCHYVF